MDKIVLNHEDVLQLLPDRADDTHKGNYGRILLLCGSRGFTGAAALAAMGALRSGAGLVYLGVPESIYEIEAVKLLEPIVIPLADEGGMLSSRALDEINAMLPKMDAVLVGPGIGKSAGTWSVVKAVAESYAGPLVLDADGINVLSGHTDVLRGRKGSTILTPHQREFARIGGRLDMDLAEGARDLAKKLGAIVLRKAHESVITDGEKVYINRTGNPGMAVGGSGDVLAGMIVSLLGQGISPLQATAIGAWLHGRSGDICAEELGQYGMLPSDMLNVLPRLMK